MKVMVTGTFDILHPGHIDMFRQAKLLGDELVAVIARDKTVYEVKKSMPMHDENERLKEVSKHVDRAILGNLGNKYNIIEEENPDILCLGYDQKAFTEELEEELLRRNLDIQIVRLTPFKPDKFKSSKIKQDLNMNGDS